MRRPLLWLLVAGVGWLCSITGKEYDAGDWGIDLSGDYEDASIPLRVIYVTTDPILDCGTIEICSTAETIISLTCTHENGTTVTTNYTCPAVAANGKLRHSPILDFMVPVCMALVIPSGMMLGRASFKFALYLHKRGTDRGQRETCVVGCAGTSEVDGQPPSSVEKQHV